MKKQLRDLQALREGYDREIVKPGLKSEVIG